MRRDNDEYREAHSGPGETSREAGADDVSLEESPEQNLLWDQTVDTEDVTEEAPSSARRLCPDVGRCVHATEKGYVELVWDLSRDLQGLYREAEATTEKLAEQEAKRSELDQKVQLLVEEAGRARDLQKRLDDKIGELVSAKKEFTSNGSDLEEKRRNNGHLKVELGVVQAAFDRDGRVIHDFARRVCTGYTSLMRAQDSSCLDRLKTVFSDRQALGEYLSGFCVRVGEDSHSLHVWDEDSIEESGVGPLRQRAVTVVMFFLVRLLYRSLVAELSVSPYFLEKQNEQMTENGDHKYISATKM